MSYRCRCGGNALSLSMDRAFINRMIDFEQAIVRTRPPHCPKCPPGTHLPVAQIQLVNAFDNSGPLFRCRYCKHKFHHGEPFRP